MKQQNKMIIRRIIAFVLVFLSLLSHIPVNILASEPIGNYIRIDQDYYQLADTSDLVDANLALLRWHANGNNDREGNVIVSASFDGVVTERYEEVYALVYNRLLTSPETKHLNGGDTLFGSELSGNVHIFAISGTVNLATKTTFDTGVKIIVLAKDSTAKISITRTGSTSISNILMTSSSTTAKRPSVSFQGLSDTQKLRITNKNTAYSNNIFSLEAGNLYYNYCTIDGFQFREKNSSTASARNSSFLVLPSGKDRIRFVYLTNSQMSGLVAQEAPGIFCKAYYSSTSSSANTYNNQSYLYLYQNMFLDCKSIGSSASAYGGAVIRSYAADQCHLRVIDCIFDNNHSTTIGGASGGGAIYWKSVPGDAILTDCVFRNNSSKTVGGAIYNTGTMELYGCTFEENYAKDGGGAIAVEPPYTSSEYKSLKGINMSGSLELDSNTVIKDNTTDGNGGAIYFNAYASQIGDPGKTNSFDIEEYEMTLDINGAQIIGNKAKGNGGAIAMWLNYEDREYTSGITIRGESLIRGNIAGYIGDDGVGTGMGDGGAIWMGSAVDCDCTTELNDGVIMLSGTLLGNEARNGGGIYIETGKPSMSMDFTMTGGTAKQNIANNFGGAAYVAGGNFELNGVDAVITGNRAIDGAGVYLTGGTPRLLSGTMIANAASGNGGGIYIDRQEVALTPESSVKIAKNTAANGAGIYIGGTVGQHASFSVSKESKGVVEIQGNQASENGGGVCIDNGEFDLNSDKIRMEDNNAWFGGAVAVMSGDFTMSGGLIGGEGTGNTAHNGGAVYVNGGNAFVIGGTILGNQASENGGGVAVNNGNYYMVGGNVDGNKSLNGSGGGIYVAANDSDVNVGIYSGSVSSNTSGGNGGALAVVGKQDSTKDIHVQIGVQKHHFDDKGNVVCDHDLLEITDDSILACPQLNSNSAGASGGGVFVTGNKNTELNIYCLTEKDGKQNSAGADGGQSNFMKVEGGKVTITTSNKDNMNADNLSGQDAHHGSTQIISTIYVTGGNMQLWGEMTNPSIIDVITVDITKAGDTFDDYRLNGDQTDNKDKRFKLKYFENFKDPITQATTGQYKEYEIDYGENVTISGNIYSHPGYTIKGWNTKKGDPKDNLDDFKQKDPEHMHEPWGWYDVGLEYLFDGNPIGNLTIYAIWEPNGYTVIYDANADSYIGEMTNDAFLYNEETKLKKNAYKRSGYNFVGWCTDKEPTTSSVIYKDQQTVVNLTTEKGAVVTLYAQWEKCDHNSLTHTYSYSVLDDGKTLKRTCVCDGYSDEVRLSAQDYVYDKNTHPATVVYTSEKWKPNVNYEALDADDELIDGLPYYAGKYKASVTENGYTASVIYTIEKAQQAAPNKPVYDTTLKADSSVLSIEPVSPSSYTTSDSNGYNSKIEYKLVYYVNDIKQTKSVITEQSPSTLIDGRFAAQFEVDVILTNYYVYVCYTEGSNYKASADSAADSVYFFAGHNVEILVNNPAGIMKEITMADGSENNILNGALLTLNILDGFYFPQGYDDAITWYAKRTLIGEENEPSTVTFNTKQSCSEYTIQNIQDYTKIVITLPEVNAFLSLSPNITEGQNFENIKTNSATISRDSAYTVCFEIKHYVTGEYQTPILSFSSALPKGTTIIMQDKICGGYYWTLIENSSTTQLNITDFVRMGDKDKTQFVLTDGDMQLQFVVDFSQAETEMLGDIITTSMIVDKIPNSNAKAESSDEKAYLKDVDKFILTSENNGTLTFQRDTSDGAASKWYNRDTALVFIPKTALPADINLQLVCGNSTTTVYANSDGNYIYSMPKDLKGSISVSLVSNSRLETSTYSFDVKWIVSKSQVEKSPMNAQSVADTEFTVSYEEKKVASLKISGNEKLYTVGGTVDAQVSWADLALNHNLEVVLMVKSGDGEYSSTGVTKEIYFTNETGTVPITISLAGNSAGSYCLQLTADQGLVRVAQARYYFIVQ